MNEKSDIDVSGIPGPSSIPRSNTENDSSSDSSIFAPPPSRRQKKFCENWLEDPQFKVWIKQCTDDPYRVKCSVCDKTFSADRSKLRRHGRSALHIATMQYKARKEAEGVLEDDESCESILTRSVKAAEIRFCLDIIAHNRSFCSFQHFVKMIQEAAPDSNILKKITLKRSKISAITKNVLNKSIISKTMQTLQNKYFLILIDESMDIFETKVVCFLIRYFHEGEVQTHLLDLIRIKESNAECLYECLLYCSKKYNFSVNNIVGACTDNASVMLGKRNSVISRLIKDNAEIAIFPCICHAMHLIACHACAHLPDHVEQFLHDICSYFSRSPKRQSMLENTQEFMQAAKMKILQPSVTRWLALSECIKRILNQWDVLCGIFAEASLGENCETAKKIFKYFNCPYTKAYLEFLKYVLNVLTKFNALFQSTDILLHNLLSECYVVLRFLGNNFIKREHLREPNFHEIDIYNEDNLQPLTSICIGHESLTTVNGIQQSNTDNDAIVEFYKNIKKFYQCAFENCVKRLPFKETFLAALKFLNPQSALDTIRHEGELDPIFSKYPSKFNRADVIDEWNSLASYFSQDDVDNLGTLPIPQFWYKIGNIKYPSGVLVFKNITELAQLCLSLVHSNADVERFFSIVNEIKAKDRNRLRTETVAALSRIKLDFKNKNKCCHNYEITDEMLALFNSSMYAKEFIPKELHGIILPDTDESSASEQSEN